MAGAAIPGNFGVSVPTGGVRSGSSGNLAWASVSPLTNPDFMKLFQTTQNNIPTEMNSLQSMIQGGMNSPLLQAVLGPAMARLQAPQAAARTNLTEATRAAGGLRGSTYGQDYNTLQNNQAQQGNDLMAQVIQQVLSTLVGGQLQEQKNAFLPATAMTDLLKTIKPDLATAKGVPTDSTGWESIPPSLGLATPMSGGSSNLADMLRMMGGGAGTKPAAGVSTGTGVAPGAAGPPPQYVDPFAGNGGAGEGGYQGLGNTSYRPDPFASLAATNYGVLNPGQTTDNSYEGWW
jgi:hypothetical protein